MKKGLKLYFDKSNIKPIKINKIAEFYNKIKEKRDNAKLDYNYHCFQDKELKGQIAAYNDVLSLMESMFEEVEKCQIKNQ